MPDGIKIAVGDDARWNKDLHVFGTEDVARLDPVGKLAIEGPPPNGGDLGSDQPEQKIKESEYINEVVYFIDDG